MISYLYPPARFALRRSSSVITRPWSRGPILAIVFIAPSPRTSDTEAPFFTRPTPLTPAAAESLHVPRVPFGFQRLRQTARAKSSRILRPPLPARSRQL